jgi:hypothetical protein
VGYVRGLMHGALAGAILGLLYAPEAGIVTRRRVSRWLVEAEDMIGAGATGRPAEPPIRRRASASRTEGPTGRS